MLIPQLRLFAAAINLLICFAANAQDRNAPAIITLLIPAVPITTSLKVDGVELDEEIASDGIRKLVTPELKVGKAYEYKIEAKIVPNNYTEIFRTREITFKAGEEVTVDLRIQDKFDDIHIRWVPTPEIVIKDMCKLARVGKDDVVMDPGCGDAIMIITAVQDFAAQRGKGIDIDTMKIQESLANVEKAGLKRKIAIKEGNALKLTTDDLGDVTVLMLYMGNELNARMRPLIWEHMKPGARIVSHRFIMGDWKPCETITVTRAGYYGIEDFTLHVWTLTGKEKEGDYPKVVQNTIEN